VVHARHALVRTHVGRPAAQVALEVERARGVRVAGPEARRARPQVQVALRGADRARVAVDVRGAAAPSALVSGSF
jgi:hypothetical protein